MSLFDWLLIGHLVGDFLIQTDSMANYKGKHWPWMLRHVGLYLAVIGVVLAAHAMSYSFPVWLLAPALLFIGVTHVVLDRRGFPDWWMRLIGISPDHEWLPVIVDQVFHLLSLAIVAQILAWVAD